MTPEDVHEITDGHGYCSRPGSVIKGMPVRLQPVSRARLKVMFVSTVPRARVNVSMVLAKLISSAERSHAPAMAALRLTPPQHTTRMGDTPALTQRRNSFLAAGQVLVMMS
jgi:hypothetical protein